MSVVLISFARMPEASRDVLMRGPRLGGQVKDDKIVLAIYGEDSCGLAKALGNLSGVVREAGPWPTWTIPFEGQVTYDLLKKLYLNAAGAVVPSVLLQTTPSLSVEGAIDGWTILKLGGAEYPHFDGLVGRLQAAGCEAEAIIGRDGYPAVRFNFTNPNEFAELIRLVESDGLIVDTPGTWCRAVSFGIVKT